MHALWLSEAVQPTSSALCLLEGEGTFIKEVQMSGQWLIVSQGYHQLLPLGKLASFVLTTVTHNEGLVDNSDVGYH